MTDRIVEKRANLIAHFFESKKNVNCLLELEKDLLSSDESNIFESVDTIDELFNQIFEKDMLRPSGNSGNSQELFRSWLIERYDSFVLHLVLYLVHENEAIAEKSLHVLMNFIVLEGRKPIKAVQKDLWFFPKELYKKILSGIASAYVITEAKVVNKFQSYLLYDDIKMYTLKTVMILLNQKEVTDVFLTNIYSILSSLQYPDFSHTETNSSASTLLSQEELTVSFSLKEKLFCKLFSSVWLQFLKLSLPVPLLKKILLTAHKQIVPHLQNPCLLTDFLTDAYSHGGIISLLSLNGLYVLMEKYNVEYPDFFPKLYSLFDESIVNSKYNARFFYLADLFLSSTHLPAYLVASFAKKLSRIALNSTTENILKIIPTVLNLLIRHPSLSILVHRTVPSELEMDPFNFQTEDPTKTNALESSLWEFKTLQAHVNNTVSRKARIINCEIPNLEYDVSAIIGLTSSKLYEKERKRKFTLAPLNVQKPSKLFKWTEFSKTS